MSFDYLINHHRLPVLLPESFWGTPSAVKNFLTLSQQVRYCSHSVSICQTTSRYLRTHPANLTHSMSTVLGINPYLVLSTGN